MAMPARGSVQFDEGYPPSSDADLDPGPDTAESLDDADRAAAGEQRVALEGHGPDESTSDDELPAEF
jgi:hypothetical protein